MAFVEEVSFLFVGLGYYGKSFAAFVFEVVVYDVCGDLKLCVPVYVCDSVEGFFVVDFAGEYVDVVVVPFDAGYALEVGVESYEEFCFLAVLFFE